MLYLCIFKKHGTRQLNCPFHFCRLCMWKLSTYYFTADNFIINIILRVYSVSLESQSPHNCSYPTQGTSSFTWWTRQHSHTWHCLQKNKNRMWEVITNYKSREISTTIALRPFIYIFHFCWEATTYSEDHDALFSSSLDENRKGFAIKSHWNNVTHFLLLSSRQVFLLLTVLTPIWMPSKMQFLLTSL